MPKTVQTREVYVSCRDQQINGRQYVTGEVVQGADALRTLPALLKTNRLRVSSVVVIPDEEVTVADLGTTEIEQSVMSSRPKKETAKKTVTPKRRAARKTR